MTTPNNATLSNGHKFIAIDILRAIAALGVYLYHTRAGSLATKHLHVSFFESADTFGALYAVPLFFLLSGYCIHASNIKYIKADRSLPLRTYYLRRFLRIYPPYLIALLFSKAVLFIIKPNYESDVADILVHLFSLQGFSVAYFNTINVVFWTITIELAFYAIYPIFYHVTVRYGLDRALAVVFAVSCISIGACMYAGDAITLPLFYNVFNLWFAWCCGAFLAHKLASSSAGVKRPVYYAIYLAIVVGFVYLNFFSNDLPLIAYQFKILIWTGPLVIMLSLETWFQQKQNTWLIKALTILGISSYSLYLLHEPLISLKNWAVHQYLPTQAHQATNILGVLIIPMIAYAHYHWVEVPFLNIRPKSAVAKKVAFKQKTP